MRNKGTYGSFRTSLLLKRIQTGLPRPFIGNLGSPMTPPDQKSLSKSLNLHTGGLCIIPCKVLKLGLKTDFENDF